MPAKPKPAPTTPPQAEPAEPGPTDSAAPAVSRRVAANRANAANSTGPRTPEGKAVSRWNAVRHGLRSRVLIPPPLAGQESPAEFEALHQALRAEFAPATPFEELLVESIAANQWRLARVIRAEGRAILSAQAARRLDIEFAQELDALTAPQPGAGEPGTSPTLRPEDVSLPDPEQALPLLRYEAHLERQIYRALTALEHLQARRRARRPGRPPP